jgi:hypothetical protein
MHWACGAAIVDLLTALPRAESDHGYPKIPLFIIMRPSKIAMCVGITSFFRPKNPIVDFYISHFIPFYPCCWLVGWLAGWRDGWLAVVVVAVVS